MSKQLIGAVRSFCQTHGFDSTYWLAYSGGLDSHVLLHLFAQLRSEYSLLKLQAVHIHHGLSPHANHWMQHCDEICKKLTVPLITITIDATAATGESQEEIARERRYGAFNQLLSANDVLLTAHHQDDQAETLLLQLLRGAGPKGLAAMPPVKKFANGFHARPLLRFTRTELMEYAKANALQWIDDESNANVNFSRNFLRHEVIPVLKKRWPSVAQTFGRAAENCAEAQRLLDDIAEQDLQSATGQTPFMLSIAACLHLSEVRQRNLLRAWLSKLKFPVPSLVKLKQIQHDMLQARKDKLPYFHWCGFELRRYQGFLYALHMLPSHNVKQKVIWHTAQPLRLLNIGMLYANNLQKTVTVRFRQGGEVLDLPMRGGHHSLKKLFQEWQIPPWQRDRVPLIFEEGQLVAVVGYTHLDLFGLQVEVDSF